MKTITVSNLAGGSAKTLSSLFISTISAATGRKTVLIDADPQCSSTDYYNVTDDHAKKQNLLVACQKPKSKNLLPVGDNLDLLPAHIDLATFDGVYATDKGRFTILSKLIEKMEHDIAIIDCPSYGGLITQNALIAADIVVIPVDASVKAVENAHNVINNIIQINEQFGKVIKTFVLPTKIGALPFSYTRKYFHDEIRALPCSILSPIPASNDILKQHNEKRLQMSGKVYNLYKTAFEEICQ